MSLALPTLPGKEQWYLLADTGRGGCRLKGTGEAASTKAEDDPGGTSHNLDTGRREI